MEIQHEGNVIYRCVPRENLEINQYWMCDEGRFNYRYTQDESRIVEPSFRSADGLKPASWQDAIEKTEAHIRTGEVLFLVGTDLTNEELSSIREAAGVLGSGIKIRTFGTPGVLRVSEDGTQDNILKMKSKTANLNGAEKLGLEPLSGEARATTVVVFRGGRAAMPRIEAKWSAGIGVFNREEAAAFDTVLPGLAFTEKEGTVTNHAGTEQRLIKAVRPKGACKPASEILMSLLNIKKKAGHA
jgi:NADH-quinone oxidoreductase subunit G